MRAHTCCRIFFCANLSRTGWDLSTLLQSSRITGIVEEREGARISGFQGVFWQRGYFNWASLSEEISQGVVSPQAFVAWFTGVRSWREDAWKKRVVRSHPEVGSPLNGGAWPGIPERYADTADRGDRAIKMEQRDYLNLACNVTKKVEEEEGGGKNGGRNVGIFFQLPADTCRI